LDHNQLTTLPSTIDNLQQLTTLHLNDNALTGIVAALGNITGLRFLYMQENDLMETFPATFSQLTMLSR
jgi:Leucine-rich repeat (LRR) protein